MKRLLTLFAVCFLLFLLNQGMQYLNFARPEFLRNHLNDFLVLPITLTICLFVTRHLHSNNGIRLPLFSCFSVAALYSVYFEYFLPLKTVRYTADPIDVSLYFAGALLFFFAQPARKKLRQKA